MRPPPEWPCDLDPAEYNLASAWWRADQRRWVGCHHGVGQLDWLEACGCDKCAGLAAGLRASRHRAQPAPSRPPVDEQRTVEVGPVREHVEQLLAAGMTRAELAAAAGIDRTTIGRLLRPDVARVHVDTAETLLAVVA